MTATHVDVETPTGHLYATAEFDSLPQTPVTTPGQSVWTQLARDFGRLCSARSTLPEYAQWRERHGWRADTPAELVADLRDNPHDLGAVVAYYQAGSKLAAAILVEAFRPALITFTRYARLDDCEQIDRPEVRAQMVMVTFYDVASTTDPDSLSIAGRLYGETLKRVTRERPNVAQYPASGCFAYEHWDGAGTGDGTHQARVTRSYHEDYRGRREYNTRPATIDVAPVAVRAHTDWEAIERKGLVRDIVTNARESGVINRLEFGLLCGRFLGDTLVPVPTLARSLGESVSYCETKLRRALGKLRAHYTLPGGAAARAVA